MEDNRPMTKRELKAARRAEKFEESKIENRQSTVKWVIIGLASVLFLAFFIVLVFLAKQNNTSENVSSFKLSESGWSMGSDSAKLTLIEFADFQCPACRVYHPVVKELLASYEEGQIKFIFKHFPLTTIHSNAMASGIAAEAAGNQGKFFEYHDLLYEMQDVWATLTASDARAKFIEYAKELNLDEEKFTSDLESKEIENKIKAEQEEGINAGVSGTPTFFVNGQKIQNPQNLEAFKALINSNLK